MDSSSTMYAEINKPASSKINKVSALALLGSVLTIVSPILPEPFRFVTSAEGQAQVLGAVGVLTPIVTMLLRTFWTAK